MPPFGTAEPGVGATFLACSKLKLLPARVCPGGLYLLGSLNPPLCPPALPGSPTGGFAPPVVDAGDRGFPPPPNNLLLIKLKMSRPALIVTIAPPMAPTIDNIGCSNKIPAVIPAIHFQFFATQPNH